MSPSTRRICLFAYLVLLFSSAGTSLREFTNNAVPRLYRPFFRTFRQVDLIPMGLVTVLLSSAL